jgi:WWE domain
MMAADDDGRPVGQEGEREMIYAKLLVGNAITKNRESQQQIDDCRNLKFPPYIPGTNPKLRYNTVTGTAAGLQVWVVYENGRAYPDYLVRYYRGERDPLRTPFEMNPVGVEAAPAREMIWEYQDNNGWREYGRLHQDIIESAYLAFLDDPNMNTVQIRTDLWTYELDLVAMVQTNVEHPSHNRRPIRRRDATLIDV